MTENEKKKIEQEVYEFLSSRVSGTVPLDVSNLCNDLAKYFYELGQKEIGRRITKENLDDLTYLTECYGDGGSITEEDEKVLSRYSNFFEFLENLRLLGE